MAGRKKSGKKGPVRVRSMSTAALLTHGTKSGSNASEAVTELRRRYRKRRRGAKAKRTASPTRSTRRSKGGRSSRGGAKGGQGSLF